MADPRVEAMTLTPRGRFAADQMVAAWRSGASVDEMVRVFRNAAGEASEELERGLLKQCVAILLASAGVDVCLINTWLRE